MYTKPLSEPAQALRDTAEAFGIPRSELAELAGVSLSTINNMFSGYYGRSRLNVNSLVDKLPAEAKRYYQAKLSQMLN